ILRDFLAGGSATDDRDPAPVRQPLTAVINNAIIPVDVNTLFPLNVATVVTFSYRDAAGNVGSATATVDVLPTIVIDRTPPIAVLDVAHQMLSGTALTLSGAHSTDVGGTVVGYRWVLADAGIDVETTTPTYVVAASAPLALGSHSVTLFVTDSSGNGSAA